MGLPGGISKFCGRIYGISRDGDQMRACLGLELRALDDVEAALRVSCFKFGPKGINVEPGKPVPTDEDDEDDDDDDDDFDLPGDDDDDDDDDEDDDVFGLEDDDDNDSENTVESGETDYTGFSALSDEFLESFFESDSSNKKKKPNNINGVPINYKPQQIITSKPIVATTAPSKKVKPLRVVTTKLVLSTPVSTERPVTAPNLSTDKVYISSPSEKLYLTSSSNKHTTANKVILNSEKVGSTADKVYVSPSQYKPTERIRPQTIKQTLESYVPTMPQLSTEKVYTSPQQISTDKIYVNSVSQQTTENYISTMDDKEQPTINYYIPTTQQFQSTEKVYIPVNLSTPEGDFEPVTSTSMSVSIIQGDDTKSLNVSNDNMVQVSTSATEPTPDNEYNEVDSDLKTTINDRVMEVNTVSSTIPLKVNRPSTKPPKDDDDVDDFEAVVDTAASVFDVEDDSKKNDTSSEEIDLDDDDDDLDDSDEDLNDGNSSNIVLASDSANSQDYPGDDDDDDDEFRKFDLHSKQTITLSSTSSSTPYKSSREHRRMNLPALFNQKPEVASLLNSGGHLYKIRMSSVQEPQQNPPRLGKLNLFVPAVDSVLNPLHIFNSNPVHPTPISNVPSHRFGMEREQEHRSSRTHKRMRLPPVESSTNTDSH